MLWVLNRSAYSLEAPWRGASNEYPQHMFSSRNEKNIMWIPPFICSYGKLDKFYTDVSAFIFNFMFNLKL